MSATLTTLAINSTCARDDHSTGAATTTWAEPEVAFRERPKSSVRRACERGMVTAEYAVGILAAIALAMVLVNVFADGTFKKEMLHQVTKLIGQIGAQI
ncbi:MAG: DUF4244 domain-containing protein [Luteococcus sp.]|uniref:DUF4244 domain-containing protein n=1 Tax=Luteococcus sp. TaxID=1969402 RepID=UPI002647D579|nr:DUF4244 domain-containing protein [Luteococcus sp.]MDN5564290.1 DUF4244 domain-containing protein [Luteococcus sp.]